MLTDSDLNHVKQEIKKIVK